MKNIQTDDHRPLLREAAPWVATIGLAVCASTYLAMIVYVFWSDAETTKKFLYQQVRVVVGLPMSAVSAFCVVWVLEATSGEIELEALGFKFKGASGPVVLWVMSFLAFVFAMRYLWIP